MVNLRKMKEFVSRYDKLILFSLIIIYIIIFSLLSLKKYNNFGYNNYDLAIFNQVFFNTIHGRWFDMTVNLNNYLADHFTPIIFLVLPFYYFKQTPETLLVLQSIILGLSAWPLYFLAKKIIGNNFFALGVSILWLLNPSVHSANMFEFHLFPIIALLFFILFYFYYIKRFRIFLLFFVLMLLIREDVSLLLFGFSILAFIDKRSWKWKLTPAILSILYFLIAIHIINGFSLASSYKFFIYYSWAGGHDLVSILISWVKHPLLVLRFLFRPINILSFFVLMSYFLFLPLVKPKYLLLAIIPFFQFALSYSGFGSVVLSTHYIMIILPTVFISFIFVLKKINSNKKFIGSKFIYDNKIFILILLSITTFYFIYSFSPTRHVLSLNFDIKQSTREKFINKIPEDASVCAESVFLSKLSSRELIYPFWLSYIGRGPFAQFDFKLPQVDYILIDYSDFLITLADIQYSDFWTNKEEMPNYWNDVLEKYVLIDALNNVYLWQDKNKYNSEGLKLYELNDKEKKQQNKNFLVGWQINKQENKNILELNLQKIDDDSDYLVRFYYSGNSFDTLLDYGILPIREWPEDKLVSFYYYPDNNVESFQIFKWSGINRLSDIRNIETELILLPITEEIKL